MEENNRHLAAKEKKGDLLSEEWGSRQVFPKEESEKDD